MRQNSMVRQLTALYLCVVVLVFLCFVAGCAPLFIAAGVEIEHDEWCKTHLADPHCQ